MEEKNKSSNFIWLSIVFLVILLGLVIIVLGIIQGKRSPRRVLAPTPTPTPVPTLVSPEDSAQEALKEVEGMTIPEFEEEFKNLEEEINSL